MSRLSAQPHGGVIDSTPPPAPPWPSVLPILERAERLNRPPQNDDGAAEAARRAFELLVLANGDRQVRRTEHVSVGEGVTRRGAGLRGNTPFSVCAETPLILIVAPLTLIVWFLGFELTVAPAGSASWVIATPLSPVNGGQVSAVPPQSARAFSMFTCAWMFCSSRLTAKFSCTNDAVGELAQPVPPVVLVIRTPPCCWTTPEVPAGLIVPPPTGKNVFGRVCVAGAIGTEMFPQCDDRSFSTTLPGVRAPVTCAVPLTIFTVFGW